MRKKFAKFFRMILENCRLCCSCKFITIMCISVCGWGEGGLRTYGSADVRNHGKPNVPSLFFEKAGYNKTMTWVILVSISVKILFVLK